MPGRYFFSREPRQHTVTDPVAADPLMSAIFLGAVAFSAYGTMYVGDNLLPRGGLRKAAPHSAAAVGQGNATGGATSMSPNGFESMAGMQDYIVAAIPFFFFLMGVEALLMWVQSFRPTAAHYCAVDTWSSLTAGVTQTLMQMLAKPFWPMTFVYCFVWDHWRITNSFVDSDDWTVVVLSFVIGDFCYYWYHRNAHEIHFLWAGHSVHHSAEHFNLSTALRQSWQQALLSGIWSLPSALFLPPRAYMLAQQWVTLYQFWIHTSVVRRLPEAVELVMVTPSHHRMHHDRRLHKNFAGVFVIWDRLFGTFHDELADFVPGHSHAPPTDPLKRAVLAGANTNASLPPVPDNGGEEMAYYGISEPIHSWADVVPQQQVWDKLRRIALRNPLYIALRHFVVGPGFYTSTVRRLLPAVAPDDMPRLRVDVSQVTTAAKVYVWALFLWTLYAFVKIMLVMGKMTVAQSSIALLFVLISMTIQGLVYDRWTYAFHMEAARCAAGAVLFAYFPFDYCAEWHVAAFAAVCLFRRHIFV
jgi:sterol desaturase/sphingolipid hydroxylase (fatty acid hydroxylase superfamily)